MRLWRIKTNPPKAGKNLIFEIASRLYVTPPRSRVPNGAFIGAAKKLEQDNLISVTISTILYYFFSLNNRDVTGIFSLCLENIIDIHGAPESDAASSRQKTWQGVSHKNGPIEQYYLTVVMLMMT